MLIWETVLFSNPDFPHYICAIRILKSHNIPMTIPLTCELIVITPWEGECTNGLITPRKWSKLGVVLNFYLLIHWRLFLLLTPSEQSEVGVVLNLYLLEGVHLFLFWVIFISASSIPIVIYVTTSHTFSRMQIGTYLHS